MRSQILVQKFIIGLFIAAAATTAYSQNMPAPRQEKLLNGLKVLMWNDARADKVWIKIRIHAGSAFDPQGEEGVMQILSDNLFPNEGAREYFSDNLGGSLDVVTNYDYIQVNASCKPESLLTMIETLATAVANPSIDKDTTVKLRNALTAKLKALGADPEYIADQAVSKRLFGTFPYGRPQFGTPASLQKIDYADLIDAKARFLTADNATVTISGNYDKDLAYRAVRRYFGAWLKADKKSPSTFRQPDEPLAGLLAIASPEPNESVLRFAIRGVARNDKDLAASMVFTSILESRLLVRVPAARSGDISVANEYHMLPGIISIGFNEKKDSSGWTIGKVEANELVAKLLKDPVTETEFQTAKTAIQTQWSKKDPISFWLDADTYKIANPSIDARIVENLVFADINVYAEKVRKTPIVGVLVNTAAQN